MTTNTPEEGNQAVARTMSWERLFWSIGGFHSATLLQPQCRALGSKYASMGALVLLTGVLAGCSGGYAIYTIFHDPEVTAVMSAIWCLLIFNLDRFLVSCMRKQAVLRNFHKEPDAVVPYKHRGPWLTLAVRLPLAVVIGLVVSAPIVTRLMQPWINDYERAREEIQWKAIETHPRIAKLQHDVDELLAAVKEQGAEVKSRSDDFAHEIDGTGGSGHWGVKKIAEGKRRLLLDAQAELNSLKDRLTQAQNQLRDERERQAKSVQSNLNSHARQRSIISDLGVVRELAATPGTQGETVRITSIFLTLLFALIECIPVLAKSISPYDAYDAILQERDHGCIMDCLVEVRRRYAEASLSD